MSMERARYPECGAPVGGEHHQVVTKITRAMEMEDYVEMVDMNKELERA